MIPRIDAQALFDPDAPGHAAAREELRRGAEEAGFFTLHGTALGRRRIETVLEQYRAFFALPEAEKARVDMSRTGSNRGWGASRTERVDPGANPDLKEVFDFGHEWPESGLATYAPNLWPVRPLRFREILEDYFRDACKVALDLLSAISSVAGEDPEYFRSRFSRPMALLRGNYYPPRPDWAGAKDFGIGAHTDYGCLTLLATDGQSGLEVQGRSGDWIPLAAEPGEFIVNFGEMLEMWTAGRVRATPHRVAELGTERISVPLFFNPRFDADVSPRGAETIRAQDHLQKRYEETYLHLAEARG